MRACRRAATIASAVVLAWGATLAAAPGAVGGAQPLRLVTARMLNPRLEQLLFRTPAVAGITGVRVLLPSGYGRLPGRRYPVLYLLHGALDSYTSWTVKGAAQSLTAPYPVIVVMPDSGTSGGYTNWWNGGRGGPPEWETYHIDQLIPWIDAHLRTRPSRAERAVAGLSMGGFGAVSYAARHPDLFAAAASFSGAVDTNNPLDIAITPTAVFGPRATEEVIWRAHNPFDLAVNLRGVRLMLWTGNGQPRGPFGGGDIVEQVVHQMNVAVHRRLVALGIPSTYHDYGPGGHAWPYWQRDLRATLPWLMGVFAHPAPAPRSFAYTAVAPQYAVYGWSARLRRRALEFSTLTVHGRNGFSLTGSGAATVRSATLFTPGQRVRALLSDARGRRAQWLTATSTGQVSVGLSLGPSNAQQQYTTRSPRPTVTARVQWAPSR
jgi:S-formylglutathione hydrolase FrmB